MCVHFELPPGYEWQHTHTVGGGDSGYGHMPTPYPRAIGYRIVYYCTVPLVFLGKGSSPSQRFRCQNDRLTLPKPNWHDTEYVTPK